MQIMYEDKQIQSTTETKFLWLFINNTLFWKTHIEYTKSKLSWACYTMQSVKPECVLLFGAESSVIQVAVQKFKNQDI